MRLDPARFEALYADQPDPWGFATSSYERDKYAATLAALEPGRRYSHALECGCSIGVFTERLAARCAAVVAFDAAPTAVAAARRRLGALPHVAVDEAVLPEGLPVGAFDLVVCSELLYYFDAPALVDLLAALRERVLPGGSLLLVHWRHPTRTYPLRGDEVHAIARDVLGVPPAICEVTDDYRLERFDLAGFPR